MKKLSYSINIQERPEKVYDTMLGLTSKQTYEKWTSAFEPSSTYEGSWEKGEKILFIAAVKSGKTSGMIARIVENIPANFVSIQHVGMLEDGKEITSGSKVEGWAGALENYRFEQTQNGTLLSVEVDTNEEYVEHFNKTWPTALEKLKNMCEKKQTVEK